MTKVTYVMCKFNCKCFLLLLWTCISFGTNLKTKITDIGQLNDRVPSRYATILKDATHHLSKEMDSFARMRRGIQSGPHKIEQYIPKDQRTNSNSSFNLVEVSNIDVVSKEDLKMLQEIEEYYKKILSGEVQEHPNTEAVERHKLILMNLIKQVVKLNRDNPIQINIEELLKIVLTFKSTLDNPDQLSSLAFLTHVNNNTVKDALNLNNTNNRTISAIYQLHFNNTLLSTRTSSSFNSNDPSYSQTEHSSVLSPINISNHSKDSVDVTDGVKIMSPILKKLSEIHPSILILQKIKSSVNEDDQTNNITSTKKLHGTNDTDILSKRMGLIDIEYIPEETAAAINNLQKQASINLLPNYVYGNVKEHPFAQYATLATRPRDNFALTPLSFTGLSGGFNGELPEILLELLLKDDKAMNRVKEALLQLSKGQSMSTVDSSSQFANYNQFADAFSNFDKTTQQPDIFFVDTIQLHSQDAVSSSASSSILDMTDQVAPDGLTIFLQNLKQQPVATPNVGEVTLDTRITPELATAFTTLVTDLAMAFTEFITNLTEAIAMNPLLGILLALAILALFHHLIKKHKHHKKGYGGGHHNQGGYHRSDWEFEEEYRSLDNTVRIIDQIESFQKWLQTIQNIYNEIT